MKTKEKLMQDMLTEAINNGDVSKVKGLIALGVDVDKGFHLHKVIYSQMEYPLESKKEIIKLLIQAGANVNLKNSDGYTPLNISLWGCVDQVGAKVEPDSLHSLIYDGDCSLEKAKILIDAGADVNKKYDGNIPMEAIFDIAYHSGRDATLLNAFAKLLIDSGATVDLKYILDFVKEQEQKEKNKTVTIAYQDLAHISSQYITSHTITMLRFSKVIKFLEEEIKEQEHKMQDVTKTECKTKTTEELEEEMKSQILAEIEMILKS
jgi:ankyrin repeat protein